jgi:hypothetical protein
MHIEVINFTGHESNCTINYYDNKGDYVKTYILDDLEVDLHINNQGNYSVMIKSCTCTYFDELQKNGIKKIPKEHEIVKIEYAMSECVDWESWYEKKSTNIDDFIPND